MSKDDIEIQSESAETQNATPAEEKTPAEEPETEAVSKDVNKPETEAEAVWEGLSGRTQDRVVQLVREKNKVLSENERLKAQTPNSDQPATSTQEPSENDVKQAIELLRKEGMVTKDDLNSSLTKVEDRMFLNREHQRLEDKYSGSEGLPKYVSEEVEDYARQHYYGGNLEAAYKEMYWDEIVDAETKKRSPKKTRTYTEKPSASLKIGEKPLTAETLRQRLRESDGAEWQQKNLHKIPAELLAQLSQS